MSAARASRGPVGCECPRQDSNLRAGLRRAPLYPLSYGGQECDDLISGGGAVRIHVVAGSDVADTRSSRSDLRR